MSEVTKKSEKVTTREARCGSSEGFQKQEHLVMVDSVLKELGRAEAGQ